MHRFALLASLALTLSACGASDPAPIEVPEAPVAATEVAEAAPPAEASQPSADGWLTYGAAFTSNDAVEVASLLGSPDAYVGKVVKVEGEVSAVCQSMGCWLSFQHEGTTLTVNMKDHAFSVDKKGAGSWCEAEGEVARVGEELTLTAHAVRLKAPAAAPPADGSSEPPATDAAPSKG